MPGIRKESRVLNRDYTTYSWKIHMLPDQNGQNNQLFMCTSHPYLRIVYNLLTIHVFPFPCIYGSASVIACWFKTGGSFAIHICKLHQNFLFDLHEVQSNMKKMAATQSLPTIFQVIQCLLCVLVLGNIVSFNLMKHKSPNGIS